MAKIRVHELARELNMQNKELLEKLSDLDIDATSHMSSLDEDTAGRARALLLGKKAAVVEETRVKQTVIRRRRKVVKVEPPPQEAAPEPEVTPEAVVSDEKTVDTQRAGTKKKASRQATPPKAAAALPEPEAEKKPVRRKAKVSDVEVVKGTDGPTEAATQEAKARKQPEKAPAEAPAEEPAEAKAEKPKTVKEKAKRAKKSTPAKIIKLGAALKPETRRRAPSDKKPPKDEEAKFRRVPKAKKPQPDRETPAQVFSEKEKEGRDKKGKKRPEEESQDKKFFKKKISFRKKAVVEGDELYTRDTRARKGRGRKGQKARASATDQKPLITTPKAIKRRVKIDDTIILAELAKRMGIRSSEMLSKLMSMGVMVTVNQTIDFDTAALVAAEFEFELERAAFEEEEVINIQADNPEDLLPRPPVVTIMGHVDHGKTSLLDVIRETHVTDIEPGGITQHIGAYDVSLDKGHIVFLDTPGHEAFTAMRSRGASITDIVVLVVAADDGVMPQTVEAIDHARSAGVPIIVAINKIDRENADIERVNRELSDVGLMPEEWGGDAIFVKVSAKEKKGIDELLEMILLQAELLELKANPTAMAKGRVIEARLDSGRGAIATVLVENGTLHTGDTVVCGVRYGKVRAILDDRGGRIEEAGPSLPVEIVGLSGVPDAGDELMSLENEKSAKQVSIHRAQKLRSKELAQTSRMSLESLFDQMDGGEVKALNIILKADVQGSIEAITDALKKLANDEVKIHITRSATGTITESDVNLATVSDAIIIGFNVRPSSKVQALANEEKVEIRFYAIIYDVIKDVKDAILGMMAPTFKEEVRGNAEVREVFHIPKFGTIAGSYVIDGSIERGLNVRLLRDGVVLYDGKIGSLRRFKDDVRDVQTGYECGIGIENYNDVKQGDVIECYAVEEIKPVLE